MNKETKTPQPTWATWALLQEALKPGAVAEGSVAQYCVHRLAKLVGQDPDAVVKPGKRAVIVMASDGHWARGSTLVKAAEACIKEGAARTAKVTAALVLNDDTPEVNSAGYVISNSDSEQLSIGCVGTLGGILLANKKGSHGPVTRYLLRI